jgi:hypothetical protein
MGQEKASGRVVPTGLSQAEPSSTVSALTGFDPSREQLIQRVIMAIGTASVPHEHWQPGALSSRSLGYYLGVGIDHFQHDYARHETLLRKAAEQAIAAIATEGGTAETVELGSVHEGAGPQDIAQKDHP